MNDCVYLFRSRHGDLYCCLVTLSLGQFDCFSPARLTLPRPHNLSVAFSIWSRDDDTSNHAPVHRCDDALSPLLFSNVFTSLTYIGTRTVLLHERGALSSLLYLHYGAVRSASSHVGLKDHAEQSLCPVHLNPLSIQHSGSRIDVSRSMIQVRLLDSSGLHLKAAIP